MLNILRSTSAAALVVFCIFLLSACGGSSTNLSPGTGGTSTDCTHPTKNDADACLYSSITDADGQFDAYVVNVDSITLTRLDGTVVNVLSNSTSVDFSQYTDLAEFIS